MKPGEFGGVRVDQPGHDEKGIGGTRRSVPTEKTEFFFPFSEFNEIIFA